MRFYFEKFKKSRVILLNEDMNKIEENKRLVTEYPFLIPTNIWTGDAANDYDYSFTELDQMPDGWRKSFGEDMCREIRDYLVSKNLMEDYTIIQIKEKFGELRWYANGGDRGLYDIIGKYELMSRFTCIQCGEPAEYVTTGWISPFCSKCLDGYKDHYADICDYYGVTDKERIDCLNGSNGDGDE